MPVVATLTAIALLRGDGGGPGPFFDPMRLREMLFDGLDSEADGELQRALLIVDELDALLERFRAAVDDGMDAYIEESAISATDAADLITRLEPLDRERMDVLDSVIALRRQLVQVLDEASWTAVFD